MSPLSPLDGDLVEENPNEFTIEAIRESLWPRSVMDSRKTQNLDWEPYFKYYQGQCHSALNEQGMHILVRTHQNIIDIVKKLKEGQTRDTIKESLRDLVRARQKWKNEDEALDNSIDLAARLCFMVNIGKSPSTVTRCKKLLWTSSSLKDYLKDYFSASQALSGGSFRFYRTFIAFNVERVAGIRICWTNDLADHLRVVTDGAKQVSIFHHASFLERARENPQYPAGLIDETLRTLALLFPKQDKGTKKWLRTIRSPHKIDRHLMDFQRLRSDQRQIENFTFWRERLIILKETFDDSRPARLSQWWYDRRDGHIWSTFWVAVLVLFLTVFFGVVQSIEGALQVYKAYHPSAQ
ncbi:hypothetical protein HBI55_126130 [Parastagonospora nodorum]|nr:hypothetical protein HBH47_074260 [Parastagonospora nodorum]KAH5119570.1 hypothetical protein HBH71_079980 [Parastagonospora nodorum]KAH5366225.1 hypothetical protein HBI48_065620 [Parastagonospora nodorum]KAH5378604.1 hypothetical protein HBI49_025600 [Parastagonospora nodorum]KAH5476921.1 hypothetical protein HBI28_076860 [Parastagonospora nodorum]